MENAKKDITVKTSRRTTKTIHGAANIVEGPNEKGTKDPVIQPGEKKIKEPVQQTKEDEQKKLVNFITGVLDSVRDHELIKKLTSKSATVLDQKAQFATRIIPALIAKHPAGSIAKIVSEAIGITDYYFSERGL